MASVNVQKCLAALSLGYAATIQLAVASDLSPTETQKVLHRVYVRAQRMETAHLVEQITYPYHPQKARTEIWSSPEAMHVKSDYPESEYFFDRLGFYSLTRTGNMHISGQADPLRTNWTCRLFGSDIRMLKNVRIIRKDSSYLITGGFPYFAGFGPIPWIEVTELLALDLTPLQLDYSPCSRLDDLVYLGAHPQNPRAASESVRQLFLSGGRRRFLPKERVVFHNFSAVDGIRFPSGATYYLDGQKSMERAISELTFAKPRLESLVPDFLNPHYEICDFRSRAEVFWDKESLIASGRGAPITTQKLLSLTLAKAIPLAKARHDNLLQSRTNLERTSRVEKNTPTISKELAWQVLGVIALVVAFVLSAAKTLQSRRFDDML